MSLERKKVPPLNYRAVPIVNRYLENPEDQKNFVKVGKKYRNVVIVQHQNFVTVKKKEQLEWYNNIEEFHVYEEQTGIEWPVYIENNTKIKKVVYHEKYPVKENQWLRESVDENENTLGNIERYTLGYHVEDIENRNDEDFRSYVVSHYNYLKRIFPRIKEMPEEERTIDYEFFYNAYNYLKKLYSSFGDNYRFHISERVDRFKDFEKFYDTLLSHLNPYGSINRTFIRDMSDTFSVKTTPYQLGVDIEYTDFYPIEEEISSNFYTNAVIDSRVRRIDTQFNRLKSNGDNRIESVIIPDGVTRLAEYMFDWNVGITKIVLPAQLSAIPDGLCNGLMNLVSINIPQYITSIGESAFCNCEKITSFEIPETVVRIGGHSFTETGIRRIRIPKNATEITIDAFHDMDELKELILPAQIKWNITNRPDTLIITYYGERPSDSTDFVDEIELRMKNMYDDTDEDEDEEDWEQWEGSSEEVPTRVVTPEEMSLEEE